MRDEPAAPTLLAVAHGTRDLAGIATYRALLDLVRAQRPGLTAHLSFLDLALPTPAQVLAGSRGPVVLVPLLLNTGYHVTVDLPAVRAAAPHLDIRQTAPLGPDPLLAAALADRLADAGRTPGGPGSSGPDAVVLAAAGSTDPAAGADTEVMAGLLRQRIGRPVVVGHLCANAPTPAEGVRALRAAGHRRVAVARYLMAPGHFARRAQGAGGCLASAPLGAHPDVARLVLKRYDKASAEMAWRPPGAATRTA
ncbi:sirohydrochlorin chelatase [Streptomyces sp. NBC_01591]|uniref:sirohydrochlorin chelatase n=1 Tax=Streptomyces sp. NBC_01591 TaxID=2975888 RepID=UPI002DD89692|nr:CbiX/SirB N-terminal domain-containing protein [Streptomyces sp. NBC_01591]WSD66930.1 sirohydrochlorin chelatase [Streptomyces sp. NBC_01591]